ncbi:MAG: zeta toxin family protein [Armatimonadetes bacterium]|nr:zeta toxin family protein [Armatimonadota bacterium]
MKPRLLIFAGPNGSGKSTLTTAAMLDHFGITDRIYGAGPRFYINADEIAVYLAENFPEMSQEEREQNAFRRARWLRLNYRLLRQSFAFETVFSHPSTLLDMQLCKAAGFEVVVVFVTTHNPEINVERVAGRYLSGGHDVPVERIRSRYKRTMALLPRILEEANRWFVFDNSGMAPELIASFDGDTRTDHALSEFWTTHLIEPMKQRSWRWQGAPDAFPPDLANGEYTGEIHKLTSHSVIQKVDSRLVRHDRLLLRAELSVGQVVTVKYKDAVGEVL